MASSTTTRTVSGLKTEVSVKNYGDAVFVVVTQLQKLGNIIQASIPPTAPLNPAPAPTPNDPNPLPPISPAIQTTQLLGQAPTEHLQTLHSLYASQIATLIWTYEGNLSALIPRRNIITAISLKQSQTKEEETVADEERALFRAVMEMVDELLTRK